MTTLGDVRVGSCARVRHVSGDRRVRRRLLEMGLLPGTDVRVVRRAPMGDPIELRLRGYSLSIRQADATGIEVEAVRELDGSRVSTSEFAPAE